MTDMTGHPLTKMIDLYCAQYPALRETNLELSSLAFHQLYGLTLQVPRTWDVLPAIKEVLENNEYLASREKIVVIFGSTGAYRKLHKVFEERVTYFSWHEIFTGMHIAPSDIRYIQRAKAMLDSSDLTLFIDPPPVAEVMDQVRGQAAGALIIIAGAGTNE